MRQTSGAGYHTGPATPPGSFPNNWPQASVTRIGGCCARFILGRSCMTP